MEIGIIDQQGKTRHLVYKDGKLFKYKKDKTEIAKQWMLSELQEIQLLQQTRFKFIFKSKTYIWETKEEFMPFVMKLLALNKSIKANFAVNQTEVGQDDQSEATEERFVEFEATAEQPEFEINEVNERQLTKELNALEAANVYALFQVDSKQLTGELDLALGRVKLVEGRLLEYYQQLLHDGLGLRQIETTNKGQQLYTSNQKKQLAYQKELLSSVDVGDIYLEVVDMQATEMSLQRIANVLDSYKGKSTIMAVQERLAYYQQLLDAFSDRLIEQQPEQKLKNVLVWLRELYSDKFADYQQSYVTSAASKHINIFKSVCDIKVQVKKCTDVFSSKIISLNAVGLQTLKRHKKHASTDSTKQLFKFNSSAALSKTSQEEIQLEDGIGKVLAHLQEVFQEERQFSNSLFQQDLSAQVFADIGSELLNFMDVLIQQDFTVVLELLSSLSLQKVDGYLLQLYQQTIHTLTVVWDRNIEEQMSSIQQAHISKKKIILPFIRTFPMFVQRCESFTPSQSTRDVISQSYDKLFKSMFDTLQVLSQVEEDTEGAASDDKQKLFIHILNLENMHSLYNDLRGRKSLIEVKNIKAQYDLHMTSYVTAVIRRPFQKLLEYLAGVEELLKTRPHEEVAYHLKYNKSQLQKVVNTYTNKEVVHQLQALFKRVEVKHFGSDSVLLPVVWRNVQEECLRMHSRFEKIVQQCFPGVHLLFTADELVADFNQVFGL